MSALAFCFSIRGWRVRVRVWQAGLSGPGLSGPGPDLPHPNRKAIFHDHEGFTVRADCEAFVITRICGLAGAAALRVGLRVRKRSGMRAWQSVSIDSELTDPGMRAGCAARRPAHRE